MQTTSSGWAGAVVAPLRTINQGVLASWQRATASGTSYFTIGTSTIGGRDIIKGSGSAVTFFDQYAYTDYTPYAMSWAVQRKTGSYSFGVILAQADVEFDNTSKLFQPNYDATIGSGILPNRPIKISVGFQGETINQFVGFTGQPEISIGGRTMKVHLFDAFDYINSSILTTSGMGTTVSGVLTNKYADEVMSFCLNALGFGANQYVLDQSLQQKIAFAQVNGRKIGEIFADLVEAEQGLMFVDETGLIRFWNRQHFLTTSGLGSSFALNYSNLISLEYESAPIINDVTVEANVRQLSQKKKIWQLSTPLLLEPGKRTDIFADFTDANGELPTTSVDTPVNATTAATSYYITNQFSDGTGSDTSAYVSVSSTYLFGTRYRVTFNNTSTSSCYITELVLHGTPAEVVRKIQQRSYDQSSIDNYGLNPANNGQPIVLVNDYIQDDATAKSLAQTIVNENKAGSRSRFIAKCFGNPALQIGDFGTLTIPDTGQTLSVFITGITNSLNNSGEFVQELRLEQKQIKSYFRIGTSAIAGNDEIAP